MKFNENSKTWFTVRRVAPCVTAFAEFAHEEAVVSYLVEGKESCLLVDTGTGLANISAAVKRVTQKPVTVVNTHAHWDHVGGNALFPDIIEVRDGERISLDPFEFEVIATPGHSADSLVLFERNKGWLFAGDTVYFGPVFIPDAHGGLQQYKQSVRKIRKLDTRVVFPGHNSCRCSPKLIRYLHQTVERLSSTKVTRTSIPICGRLRLKFQNIVGEAAHRY